MVSPLLAPKQQTTKVRINYTRPTLYPKQEAAVFSGARLVCVEASTKSGKAQLLDSLLYTPNGTMKMRDVKIGSTILSISGTTRVTGVYPQGKKKCYRVTFSDDSYVDCSEDHLWEIHTADDAKEYGVAKYVRDTNSLRALKNLNRFWIPTPEPFAYKKKIVVADPYTLGLYIAEGYSGHGRVSISTKDQQCLDMIHNKYTIKYMKQYDYRLDGMITALHYYGLYNKRSDLKFIPKRYIYNNIETRKNILRGIMDGDGFVDARGQAHIETTSKQLAYDVQEIIESLGGYCRINYREINGYKKEGIFIRCKPVWRVNIIYSDAKDLFTLERKRRLCKSRTKYIRRTIKSIESIGLQECQCISVDHPSHLYITNHGIPTHNTFSAIVWLFELALLGSRGEIYWWVAPIYAQAKIAFLRLVKALFGSPIVAEVNRSEMIITLINGATIHFKSGDRPDSLFGEDVSGAVIDEASRLRIESFTAVRSTLTATRGPILIIGNVRGKLNWFYKLCRRIERKHLKNSHYAKITAYDAARAKVIDWEEIRDAQQLLPDDVFRELYLAQASEEGSNPFGISKIEACTIEYMSSLEPVCYGIDLAKSFDYSVIIGLDKHGQVCYFDRFQKSWELTVNDIVALPDYPMMIDSTGVGNAPVEFIQKARKADTVVGFTFTKQTKKPLMEELATSIAGREIFYPEGIITEELNDFEFEYTRTGVLYSAPVGFHDDTVSALALANRMRKQLANQPMIMISRV